MAAARPSRSPLGLFAAAVAFLLCVLFSPLVAAPFWTPRAALLLIVIAVGLPIAVQLALAGHRAAIAALAFLAVAGLSTALADQPDLAFFGLYGWGTGWLFIAALVSIWAVGVAVPSGEGRLVEKALLWGIAVNAVLAVVQVVVDLGIDELRLDGDRPMGLMGNPVHLGALMAGGLAVAAARFRNHAPLAAIGVVGIAAVIELSGTRFALAVAIGVVLLAGRRLGLRLGALLGAAAVLGIVLGSLLGQAGGGASTTERAVAGSAGGGFTPRLETWWSARHAVADAPFFGAGPGQFRSATSQYRTLKLARAEGPDKLFVDAHNLVAEYTVTTGVVGLLAFLGWAVLAASGVSGPMLGFAGAVLALHLVQPQSVAHTPLALLALGSAASATPPLPAQRVRRVAHGAIGAVAVASGAVLLAGTFALDQVNLDLKQNDASTARSLLAVWPDPYTATSRVYAYQWAISQNPSGLDAAIAWTKRAIRRDPSKPSLWIRLGELQLRAGALRPARASHQTALRHNPWSVVARIDLARTELGLGNLPRAQAYLEEAEAIATTRAARALRRELEHRRL